MFALASVSPAYCSRHCQRRRHPAPGHGDAADDVITLRLLAGDATQLEVLDGAAVIGLSRARPSSPSCQRRTRCRHHPRQRCERRVHRHPDHDDHGGDGNDTITGGAGGEILPAATAMTHRRARRHGLLQGGDGNDTLTGGPGVDPHLGGPGDDLMIWNPGDGSEPVDGEAGNDTFQFNGGAGVDTMTITPNGQRVRFFRAAGRHHDGHRHDRERARDAAGRQRHVSGSAGPRRPHRPHHRRRRRRRHPHGRRRQRHPSRRRRIRHAQRRGGQRHAHRRTERPNRTSSRTTAARATT